MQHGSWHSTPAKLPLLKARNLTCSTRANLSGRRRPSTPANQPERPTSDLLQNPRSPAIFLLAPGQAKLRLPATLSTRATTWPPAVIIRNDSAIRKARQRISLSSKNLQGSDMAAYPMPAVISSILEARTRENQLAATEPQAARSPSTTWQLFHRHPRTRRTRH